MCIRLCLISQDCDRIRLSQSDEQDNDMLTIPRITESPLYNTVNNPPVTRISRRTVGTSC